VNAKAWEPYDLYTLGVHLDKDSSHIEDFNNFVSQELIKPESNSSSALAANREDQEEVARLVARIN
jgi:hypothetical protein